MRLIETTEHELPSEVMYLEYLVLDPKDDHILLSAKSPLIHSFMRHHSKGKKTEENPDWGGRYFLVPAAKINLPPDGSVTISNPGGPIFGEMNHATHQIRTNITWLRHTALDEGMEIKIPGVVAMADFEDYLHQVADAIRNFYLQNLRKAVLSLRMGERFPEGETR